MFCACRGENSTDIFRPYSRPNPFRGVQICPYPSTDIQHPIPYPYPNNQIAYLWCRYPIVSYPSWLTISVFENPNPDRNMKTNVISVISVGIRSVFIHMCMCVYNLSLPAWVHFHNVISLLNRHWLMCRKKIGHDILLV